MHTIHITIQVEDWPEAIEEQCENLDALENITVPHGEVVEVEVEEV